MRVMTCLSCVHGIGDECSAAQCSAAARAEGCRGSTSAGGSCTEGCAAEGLPLSAACGPAAPTCACMPKETVAHLTIVMSMLLVVYCARVWVWLHSFDSVVLQVHGGCQRRMCRQHVRRRQSLPSLMMSLRALTWTASAADLDPQAPWTSYPRRRTFLRSGLSPDRHTVFGNIFQHLQVDIEGDFIGSRQTRSMAKVLERKGY